MQRSQIGKFSLITAVIVVVEVIRVLSSAHPPLADDNNLPAAQGSEQGLYNPARVAIINARQQLSESLRQEEDILEQVRRVHKELDASLALLASAEQIDPTMKAPIDALRAQLSALENDPSVAQMDSETLRSTYEHLLAEFEALIEHY
jgi:hypothetical protein